MNSIGWTHKQCILYLFPLIISVSFAMDVFVPAIPLMSQFFHIHNNIMQASLYAFMLTMAFGQLMVGPLADYYGRRGVAIMASSLFLIGSIICCLSHSIVTLIFARMIQAAGACGTYLICFIIVRDNFNTLTCARLFSTLAGINAMVASLAPIIGGILVDLTHDWHSNFYFLTILGFVMMCVAYYTIPNYHLPHSEKTNCAITHTIKYILANNNFRQYTFVASISLLGLYLFCALSPGILITKLHTTGIEYGLWFGMNALIIFVANLMAVRLTYSFSLEKIIFIALIWIICSSVLMFVLNYKNISVWRFMLPMFSLTLGIGVSLGSATALALKEFKEEASMATSMLGTCQFGLAGFMGIITAQWEPSPILLAFPLFILGSYALKKCL